jgi:hypothetical protein
MTLHTIQYYVGQRRQFLNVLDIPPGTADLDRYVRTQLRITISNQLEIQPCEFQPGFFYPRIARPQLINNSYVGGPTKGPLYIYGENMATPLPHDAVALANSLNQLSIMIEEMKAIMHHIQPDDSNLSTYGHQTRNVLLLAAMEFENECKGVLRANDYNAPSDRFSTNDFVKLLGPLRLAEYAVQLSYYPGLAPIAPFVGWTDTAPTQSLFWFDSYNAAKHDREINFSKATLEAAINAVSAVAIMLCAEYRIIEMWRDHIGFFRFNEHPQWQDWQNYLLPPQEGSWQQMQYQF